MLEVTNTSTVELCAPLKCPPPHLSNGLPVSCISGAWGGTQRFTKQDIRVCVRAEGCVSVTLRLYRLGTDKTFSVGAVHSAEVE